MAVGYCFGDSTAGQRAVYELGLTGVPVYNVNNNCATGSTALFMAKQFVAGGIADCALALGFEKMEKGSLGAKFTDRTPSHGPAHGGDGRARGKATAPAAPQMFGNAGREHMERYGTTRRVTSRRSRVKNHKHSVNNPYSQFQNEYTLEEVLAAPMVYDAAHQAAVLPDLRRRGGRRGGERGLRAQARARGAGGRDRRHGDGDRLREHVRRAELHQDGRLRHDAEGGASRSTQQSGLGPENVDVIELHDCFSTNELITYEGLGLCDAGQGRRARSTRARPPTAARWVVNPSGGLISKGHPLGATGLAQCAELTWQLRGDGRQAPGRRRARSPCSTTSASAARPS